MRDYGKVTPQFWIGETGKWLRGKPEAQIVALYLMTGPHSEWTGVFYCPVLYISHGTGLTIEGASEGLRCLIEGGFCSFEEASDTVFVFNMATYQIGDTLKDTDKRVLGLRNEIKKWPEGLVKNEFLERYNIPFSLGFLKGDGSPFGAPSKPRAGTRAVKRKNPSSNPQAADAALDDGFTNFWKAYPRHTGKAAAVKAWEKCKPDAELQATILAAIAVQANSKEWLKDGGSFIPHPATWLNGKRWEDEVGAPQAQSVWDGI